MNPVVAFSATGVIFALFNASLAARLSKAPGWGHLRYLAFNALGLVAVSLARTVECIDRSPSVVIALRFEVASFGISLLAWCAYSRAHLAVARTRPERVFELAVVAFSAAALLPGTAYTDEVTWRRIPPGLTYVDPTATWFAVVLYATLVVGAVGLLVRYVRAASRGVPGARAHILGILFGAVPLTWDAAASTVGADLPYITDPGIFLSLAIVPLALAERFRVDVATRRDEESGLAALVAERTTALGQRRDDLARYEQLASLGRISAGVSHEVNSPIAAATANVDWLLDASADEEPREEVVAALDEAARAIDRVRRIVRQLAHITGAPTTTSRSQRLDVEPALQQAVRLAEAMRDRHGGVRVERGAEGLVVVGDEGAVVQILVNLLANAIDAVDAVEPGGRVTLRATREGDHVLVTVEDDGPGMSDETLARVFEPFFTTKDVGRGTGLGLAVSRGLAASLGGALRLESRVGEGTRATLELPAAPATAAASDSPPPATEPARRRRLLLVDDEPAVRSALRRLLSRYHDVEVAGDVAEAVAAIAREPFDLVLCDVVMPDGGGQRVYREVLARAPERATRFVFVTGGAPDDATRRFLAEQPQPVLDKPVDLASLEAVVRDLAPTSRPSRTSVNPSP